MITCGFVLSHARNKKRSSIVNVTPFESLSHSIVKSQRSPYKVVKKFLASLLIAICTTMTVASIYKISFCREIVADDSPRSFFLCVWRFINLFTSELFLSSCSCVYSQISLLGAQFRLFTVDSNLWRSECRMCSGRTTTILECSNYGWHKWRENHQIIRS